MMPNSPGTLTVNTGSHDWESQVHTELWMSTQTEQMVRMETWWFRVKGPEDTQNPLDFTISLSMLYSREIFTYKDVLHSIFTIQKS